MGLADEDKEGRVSGVHVEVSDDLKFVEVFVFQKMCLIKDNDWYFLVICDRVFDAVLYGFKEF